MSAESKDPRPLIDPSSSSAIPNSYICPITHEIMIDPVTAADGHTYEREAIENWLYRLGRNTSPNTNEVLANKNLVPNHALRMAIAEFQEKEKKAAAHLATISPDALVPRDELTSQLIEEVKRQESELKSVRSILADTRRMQDAERKTYAEERKRLLPREENNRCRHFTVKNAVEVFLYVLAPTGGIIALTVMLLKGSNKNDDGCAERDNSLVYDAGGDNEYYGVTLTNNNIKAQPIVNAFEFITGANLTGVVKCEWDKPILDAKIESVFVPEIGFSYKIIFPTAWHLSSGSSTVCFSYDPNTSINLLPGIINFLPSKPSPFVVHLEDDGSRVLPYFGGGSDCARTPKQDFTHGAYIRSWRYTNIYGSDPRGAFTTLTNLFFYSNLRAKLDGTIYSQDNFTDQWLFNYLAKQRLNYPFLEQEIYLVIGGNCSVDLFSKIAADIDAFDNFRFNLLKIISILDIKGLVWDLRFGPKCSEPFDETLFVRLHEGVAKALQPLGKKLHTALPANNTLSADALCKIGEVSDKIHLMTFNYTNFPGQVSGDAAGLDKVVDSVQNYLSVREGGNNCIRPKQVLIGAPTFGRGAAVTKTTENYGYGEMVTDLLPGESGRNSSVWNYRCIIYKGACRAVSLPDLTLLPPAQAPRGNDSAEAWGYQPNGTAIFSFDTPYSVCRKVQYVKGEGLFVGSQALGGYFSWDLEGGDGGNMYPEYYGNNLMGTAALTFSTPNRSCDSPTESTIMADSSVGAILLPSTIEAMKSAAEAGAFYGFLYQLQQKGLTDLLAPTYTHQQIYYLEKTLQIIYNLGTLGCAAPSVSLLLVRLGVPKQTAEKMVGNTVLGVGLWYAFWPTVASVSASAVGSAVAVPVYQNLVKPVARGVDTTLASAVTTFGKPLGAAVGSAAGTVMAAANDLMRSGSKTPVGAIIGSAMNVASGISSRAAERCRKAWLGEQVGVATTSLLKVVGNTKAGVAASGVVGAVRQGFWAKATPASSISPPVSANPTTAPMDSII